VISYTCNTCGGPLPADLTKECPVCTAAREPALSHPPVRGVHPTANSGAPSHFVKLGPLPAGQPQVPEDQTDPECESGEE
jgi:hypothetical protein